MILFRVNVLCPKDKNKYKRENKKKRKRKKLNYLFWELLGTAVFAGVVDENAFFSAFFCKSTTLWPQGCDASFPVTGKLDAAWDPKGIKQQNNGGGEGKNRGIERGGPGIAPPFLSSFLKHRIFFFETQIFFFETQISLLIKPF